MQGPTLNVLQTSVSHLYSKTIWVVYIEYLGACLWRYGQHWRALGSVWDFWLDTGRAFHKPQCHRHQRGIDKSSTADVKSPAKEFGHLRHLVLSGYYESDESADTKSNWENKNILVNIHDIVYTFHVMVIIKGKGTLHLNRNIISDGVVWRLSLFYYSVLILVCTCTYVHFCNIWPR